MNITFERPEFLWALLLLVPVAILVARNFKKTDRVIKDFYNKKNHAMAGFSTYSLAVRLLWKNILRGLAWIMLVLALAGISWGNVSTPVQRNSNAVCFVFDISYSMTANDAPNNLTRLGASSEYARMLLEYLDGIPVSCVIAKGDGVIAIPQTEDTASIHSFLDILSPTMMSSAGSSLGRGVDVALTTFPENSSRSPVIWLFTDGDETDTTLAPAIAKAQRLGVPVTIIGFGSERESSITAGDGETVVKTALRSEKMKQICAQATKKSQSGRDFSFIKTASAKFVDASEMGSAVKILSDVKRINASGKVIPEKNDDSVTVFYETHTVNRYKLFIMLAVIFFGLSLFVSEFSLSSIKRAMALSMVLCVFALTGCGSKTRSGRVILESTMNWYQKDYNRAISGFTQVIDDKELDKNDVTKQYAIYGLSVTYLMQNEKNASLERLEQLSPDAPVKIKFAAYYNAGIIAQREGDYDKATELFKMALLVNPEDVNAKINLELSRKQEVSKTKQGQQSVTPSSENKSQMTEAEKTIFNRMRENDKQQWKNYDSMEKNNSVIDY